MSTEGELHAFLSGLPIFGGLSERTLTTLVPMLKEHSLAPNTVVCREGEPGRELYVVTDGEVVVSRLQPGLEVRVVRLGRGEMFGEMTLIDPQPRSGTVRVDKHATLLSFTNKDLFALYRLDVEGYVQILQNICRELSRRLRRADARICELAADDGDESTQIHVLPRGPSRSPSR